MTDEKVLPSDVGNASEPVILHISPEDKKADIREKMWNYMDKNQISPIYSPFGKIPNFKDTEAAGNMLTTMDVFKAAASVKVDPDKPLQAARFATLKAGKTLLVPTPRHRPGLLTKLTLPEECDDETLNKCATRQGVTEYSTHIELDETAKIDLLVVGCVAVSPKGWRIGKGSGFSDLEYAMLVSNGALSPSVPIVTVVHDSQIVDLPDSLFDVHDVAVDFIVTPTQVIQCSGAKPRPSGITWSLLVPERLDRLQILKRLRYREWKTGKDVRLTGESEQPEELTDELPSADKMSSNYARRRTSYRRKPRKPRNSEETGGDDLDDRKPNNFRDGEKGEERRGRGTRGGTRGGINRRFRRRGGPRREDGERTMSGGENDREGGSERDEEHDEGREGGPRSSTFGRRRKYGGPRGGGGRVRREVDSQAEDDDEGRDGEGKNGRRRRSRRSESDGGGASADGDSRRTADGGKARRRFVRSGGRPFYGDCEGSVYVGALPKFLRVSEFKAEVRDRNVQPLRVVWRGASGYAFLGFRTVEDAEQALEALGGLHISEHNLRLEMAKSSGGRRRGRGGAARSGDSGGGDDHVTSEDE